VPEVETTIFTSMVAQKGLAQKKNRRKGNLEGIPL
jgi:hypothetical protein